MEKSVACPRYSIIVEKLKFISRCYTNIIPVDIFKRRGDFVQIILFFNISKPKIVNVAGSSFYLIFFNFLVVSRYFKISVSCFAL